METLDYTTALANLAAAMERVCSNHDPVIITRANAPSVVMLSMEDYQSLAETVHLLRSPRNARRLLEGIDQLEDGRGVTRELDL